MSRRHHQLARGVGHQRLAAADVAVQEALHRVGLGEIAADRLDGPLLRAGRAERQHLAQPGVIHLKAPGPRGHVRVQVCGDGRGAGVSGKIRPQSLLAVWRCRSVQHAGDGLRLHGFKGGHVWLEILGSGVMGPRGASGVWVASGAGMRGAMTLAGASQIPPAVKPRSERGTAIRALGGRTFSKTDFQQANVETLDGAWRTKRPTSRRAPAGPGQVGLAVPSQPPSEPTILEQEAAC